MEQKMLVVLCEGLAGLAAGIWATGTGQYA
jgi:hypothetical protein